MGYSDRFFKAIGLNEKGISVPDLARSTGVKTDRLKYYNETNTLPIGHDLKKLQEYLGFDLVQLKLKMGIIDGDILHALQEYAESVAGIIKAKSNQDHEISPCEKVFSTELGDLYQGDCLALLATMADDSVDMIFADPPFNLKKIYPSKISDNLRSEQYLSWCEKWITECSRVLKPGGSFLLWNLPTWNAKLAAIMERYLTFRHWIATDIKYTLPISGRLYPSHYAMLYYVKGDKPKTFHPDRVPTPTCPKCDGDLKDYGGYKNKMNPRGVNISDIWADIPPVRHAKYKRRTGANELALKLMDRVVEMTTDPGDLVFDPFGGAGTTYVAAELKGRRWIGVEIGPPDDILERFKIIDSERVYLEEIRRRLNKLFPDDVKARRIKKNIWTDETFQEGKQSVLAL